MDVLRSETFEADHKKFFLDVKANPRGKFLKISELSHNRRSHVIIPDTGFEEFRMLINKLLEEGGDS